MLSSRGVVLEMIFFVTQMVQCIKRQDYSDETDLENVDTGRNYNQADTSHPTSSSYTLGIPRSLAKAIEDYIRFTKVTITSKSFEVLIRNSVQKWKDGAYVHICALFTWRLNANEPTG